MSELTSGPAAPATSPSALEMLWEKHNRLFKGTFWVLALACAAYYGISYYQRRLNDAKWESFAKSIRMDGAYSPQDVEGFSQFIGYDLIRAYLGGLKDLSEDSLKQVLATADAGQRPYVLWLMATQAARSGDWAAASRHAESLKTEYPNHPLCTESDHPVQVQSRAKAPEGKEVKVDEEPELKPPVAGSSVGLLVGQAAHSRDFQRPATWAKPEIPADAPRYRFEFEGDYGSVTIALMTQQAPKTCEVFAKLVSQEHHWDGLRVDEIQRPSPKNHWSDGHLRFHIGFSSTKADNRTDWDTENPKPSAEDRVVEELTNLSHFPGAVAARVATGKSEVDRLWFSATDGVAEDGVTQVFAYVVDGLETVRRVCDAPFATEDETNAGKGKPDGSIQIKSVTLVQ